MKSFIALLVLLVASASAFAVRYQQNSLYRIYYENPAKTIIAGEAILSCPNYVSNSGWLFLEGHETNYFNDFVGEACPNGPAVPIGCWYDLSCPTDP
ncbi:MAG: hypothetical protein QM761_08745 [Pseudoxanthomonas sp.]